MARFDKGIHLQIQKAQKTPKRDLENNNIPRTLWSNG